MLLPESTVGYAATAGWEHFAGVAPLQLERFELDDAALSTLRLEVSVATAAFSTGNIFRDLNARRVAFESHLYPDARYVATGVRTRAPNGIAATGQAPGLPDGSQREVTLTGALTLHGVRRPLEVTVTVQRQGQLVEVAGRFTVELDTFEMRAPSILGRSVDQLVTVEIDAAIRLETP